MTASAGPRRRTSVRRAAAACLSFLDWLTSAGAIVAAIATLLLVIGITSEVIYRAINHRSISGLLEVSELVIVFAAFLGTASSQRARLHVSTGILTEQLPPRLAEMLRLIGLFAVLLLMVFLAWGSIEVAIQSVLTNEYRFGLIPIPLWPGRIAIVLGYGLLLLQIARELAQRGAALLCGRPETHIHDPEQEDVGWL